MQSLFNTIRCRYSCIVMSLSAAESTLWQKLLGLKDFNEFTVINAGTQIVERSLRPGLIEALKGLGQQLRDQQRYSTTFNGMKMKYSPSYIIRREEGGF
ncbi:hypothetical protein E1B28_010483 [Marasmius oreades]|uniref:Uncharacterized protein n=1 Tax=Marasmius oreades TaxID=181124 RepID=A0A9P7RX58_9AGAR|nr:uncharacterized protein E1B28_010483 [Marasmius oreades]KAG7091449.1 hypothetical protein E1B28_010483 [Marasmius oreades]